MASQAHVEGVHGYDGEDWSANMDYAWMPAGMVVGKKLDAVG